MSKCDVTNIFHTLVPARQLQPHSPSCQCPCPRGDVPRQPVWWCTPWARSARSPDGLTSLRGEQGITRGHHGDTLQQGTHSHRGTHSSTQHHTQGTLAHLSRLSCLLFLICHLHHLKMDTAEMKEAHRNVGWRKGSMEVNTRKIYKIRENHRRQKQWQTIHCHFLINSLWQVLLLTFGGSNPTRLSRNKEAKCLISWENYPINIPTVAGAYQKVSFWSMDMMSTPCQEHWFFKHLSPVKVPEAGEPWGITKDLERHSLTLGTLPPASLAILHTQVYY